MAVLDVARGAYVRLPPSTRALLGRVLQYVPTSLKFGRTYHIWREQIERAKSDPDFVESYRRKALGDIVANALQKSPYYSRVLTPIIGKIDPNSLIGSEAWTKVPLLSRQVVLDHRSDLCTVPPDQLDRASTDGSSGQPLSFLLDRNRSPIEYAFIHDAWSRAGFTAGDWRCVFRGFDLNDSEDRKMEFEPALKELRLSVFHLNDVVMADYVRAIVDNGVKFIHGYPSAMAIFAEYITRSGRSPFRQIQGVFPISEKLYPHQRETLAKAFPDAVIVPFYGLSEKVAFAVEDATESATYQFNPLYGYTELVDDDGRPITTSGVRGRVVSTGLLFGGMPLIRYDTRDTAELVEQPDAGNGYKLIVRDLTPRRGSEYMIGRSGILIPFAGMCVPLDEHDATREVQFFQDTPGEAILYAVCEAGKTPDFSNYFRRMKERSGEELLLELRLVDQLPMSGRGKRKFIDQRLAVPEEH